MKETSTRIYVSPAVLPAGHFVPPKEMEYIMSEKTTKKTTNVRFLTLTAILSAIAVILQYLEFPVPLMPSFVKFDFSDLPAILAAFLVSPLSGVAVCVLKNVIHMAVSMSAGVGELCNCLLGIAMVIPAWLIYKVKPSKGTAALAMLGGCVIVALASLPINFFITYPFYENFYGLPMEAILGMYREINNGVGSLWDALIWFNMPFTFVKFLLDSIVVFFIYKPLARVTRKY